MAQNAYARAGVDVEVEAEASRIMYEASKQTFENRKGKIGELTTLFDDFAGLRVVDISKLPKGSVMSMGFDGTGTKAEYAQRLEVFNTIAFDLFAMLCDDAVLRGGEPALVGSVLDVRSFSKTPGYLEVVKQLAEGYVAAAKAANVAVINGEIAQMGGMISGYGKHPFNWSGACVWFGKKDRLFTGKDIRAGDAVVLLGEKGFRSNGLSLARAILSRSYGSRYERHWGNWHKHQYEDKTLGEWLLTPSMIYAPLVTHLNGGFSGERRVRVNGVVHITGGGIPEKFARVLKPTGLGVSLAIPFEPPPLMTHCQTLSKHLAKKTGSRKRFMIEPVSDHEAYKTWPMGQGMAVITTEPGIVAKEAHTFGFETRLGGYITETPEILVKSRGAERPGEWLRFKSK
jgi:phosphoribosylformylglycinamidine cyclo-ligase